MACSSHSRLIGKFVNKGSHFLILTVFWDDVLHTRVALIYFIIPELNLRPKVS
jgi:hypothetical protein